MSNFGVLLQLCCLLLVGFQVHGRCGVKPAGSRVVGGSISKPNGWPWMVQIINQRIGGSHHWCGGSLISPEWLITATHCVDKDQRYFKFVLGEHDRFGNEGSEQTFRAKKIITRDDYNKPSMINNDIALVQLDRPAILNSKVGTVCLPSSDYQIPTGSQCITAGWGLTSGGGRQSRYLKQATMPIASTRACKRVHYYIPITDQMVCAGGGGSSIENNCSSDSGGPLMCPTRNGQWKLQGVVSFGDSQCRPGKYTVYARVSKFREWIRKNTGV